MLEIRNCVSKLGCDYPLLAIDFDDVLFDCNDALQRIIRDEFNDKLPYMEFITKYPELKNEIFHFLYGSYHHKCSVICGAQNVLSHLASSFRMVVITGRSESRKEQTEEWLESNFSKLFSKVYFTNTFLGEPWEEKRSKSDLCKDVGIDILIDDSVEEAMEVSSIGIPVLLFDRPWNRIDLVDAICRVNDWNQVLHKLSNIGGINGY